MRQYCIKQHDITDCGAACLATICKQNGYKIGITQIREVAGTDTNIDYDDMNAVVTVNVTKDAASGILTGALAVISYNYYTNKIDRLTFSLDEVGEAVELLAFPLLFQPFLEPGYLVAKAGEVAGDGEGLFGHQKQSFDPLLGGWQPAHLGQGHALLQG